MIEAISSHGGEVVANASYPNCQIIAGNKQTIQIQHLLQQGQKDVLDFRYLLACWDADQLLPPRAHDYLGKSREKREHFQSQYDLFGDSYHEPITPDIFKKIIITMDSNLLAKDDSTKQLATMRRALQPQGWRQVLIEQLDGDDRIVLDNIGTCLFQSSVIMVSLH